MTATSLDLSQIKTDALSSAATFRTLIGLGSGDAVTFKEATLTSGTVTSSTPVINATQTWNEGATTFTGLKLDVTDTASASTSLLMDLQVGGSSQFKFIKSGVLQFGSVGTVNSIASLSNGNSLAVSGYLNLELQRAGVTQLYVGNGALNVRYGTQLKFVGNDNFLTSAFAALVADQLNGYVLAQRNGTNAQTFRLYNTYTSSTSFENLQLQWNTNEARIGTSVGSAGGTQRDVVFGSWDSAGTWNPALTITPQGVPTFSMGTVTSSQPFTVTQTWNDGATTFTGILANITDTASASASLLMDLQVGGSSKFKVDKNGILELGNAVGTGLGTNLPNRISCAFSNSFSFGLAGNNAFNVFGNSQSVIIYSSLSKPITFAAANGFGLITSAYGGNGVYVFDEAANVWAQRNGTNAQTFRLYNTYTSSTSFERLNVRWATNELIIDAEAGSGGGTLRGIKLGSATTSLLGFYGVTPVDQPLTVSDPTGGAIVDTEARTAIGEIIDRLQELGLIA